MLIALQGARKPYEGGMVFGGFEIVVRILGASPQGVCKANGGPVEPS